MAETPNAPLALGDSAARQLANTTKTPPQLSTITPRWLVHLLQWVPVEAGIYRVNKVRNPEDVKVACAKRDDRVTHEGLSLTTGKSFARHQNKIERISMLRRGGASGALVGSSKAVCAVIRARPSSAES